MDDETMNIPKTDAKRRHGRCFELAWLAFDDMDDPGHWRLVHGVVNGPEGISRMEHAWLTDGVVFHTVETYRNIHNAKVVATYDRKQMRDMTGRHKHFGPWDEPAEREAYLRAHDWPAAPQASPVDGRKGV
jgi:hypothetical protein